MKTKATEVDRAHGLPRIHKKYTDLPSFRAIIDTKNTPDYDIGKLLTRLLNSLTQNVFLIKDSFEAVDRIGYYQYYRRVERQVQTNERPVQASKKKTRDK